MILETIRTVTDALVTGSIGVNAQLTSLDYDAGDSAPTNILTITDETENYLAALNRPAEPTPSITVALNADVDMDGEVMTSYRDGEIELAVRIALNNDQVQNGLRDIYYYSRAIEKCLRDLARNENASMRLRNNIQVQEILEMTHRPVFREVDDATTTLTGQLVVTWKVRDIAP